MKIKKYPKDNNEIRIGYTPLPERCIKTEWQSVTLYGCKDPQSVVESLPRFTYVHNYVVVKVILRGLLYEDTWGYCAKEFFTLEKI